MLFGVPWKKMCVSKFLSGAFGGILGAFGEKRAWGRGLVGL